MSGGLIAMLRARYPAAQYAFFEELRNNTGYSGQVRTADAVAFSLWPSRGLELHGFECKVARSDWKRELAQPEKAEAIQKFCDRWWVVVSDPGFVADGELPPTWGLLAASKGFDKGSKLRVVKEAPKLDPQPLTKKILASLFRNFADSESARFNTRAFELATEQMRKAPKGQAEREAEAFRRAHEQLSDAVQKFEKDSGLSVLGGYDGERVGALLGLMGGAWNVDSLAFLRSQAQRAQEIYRQAADSAARVEAEIEQALSETKKKSEAA